jgi:hypothetical protein
MSRENPIQTYPFSGGTTTAEASSGGGVVTGAIDLGSIRRGIATVLAVQAIGNTVLSTIEFFTDSGRTDRVYLASNKDCYTVPYHIDRTPWALESDSTMLDGNLYYRITNDGINASTYLVRVSGIGMYGDDGGFE